MKLNISNLRSVKRASLPIGGISLIAGPNGAGKTSISHALAAVLGGLRQPVGKTQDETVAAMVGRERDIAGAELEIDNASRLMEWRRKANVRLEMVENGPGKGKLPECSPVGLGRLHFAKLSGVACAELLIDTYEIDPTKEDIAAEIKDRNVWLSADAVWKLVDQKGWDGAAQHAEGEARTLKGQWREAAIGRSTWGSKAAADYQPKDWRKDDTEASLDASEAEWQARRDKLVAGAAIDEARREDLKAAIDNASKAAAKFDEAEGNRLALLKEATTLEDERDALRAKEKAQECPHCQGALMIVAGKVKAAEALSEADTARIEELDKELQELGGKLKVAGERVARINAARTAGANAQAELDKAVDGVAEVDGFDQAKILAELAGINDRRLALRSKTRCDELHEKIMAQLAIKDICAPDGLRQRKMMELLDEINERLDVAGKKLGVGRIRIMDDMRVAAGLLVYEALSESEQWRVDLALQIELAKAVNDPVLVVDRLDVLAADNRQAAIMEIKDAGIPAVVLMTAGKRGGEWEGIPDFRAAGLGTTYLLEGGELKPWGVASTANDQVAA